MEAISADIVKLQGSTATLTKKVEETQVKTTPEGTESQSSVSESNSYNKYDTLDLSQAYLEYKTKSENDTVKNDTNQLISTVPKEATKAPTPEGVSETSVTESSVPVSENIDSGNSSEENISSYELSAYSVMELKSLVMEGKITTTEYNTEVKSRQEDQKSTDSQENSNVAQS